MLRGPGHDFPAYGLAAGEEDQIELLPLAQFHARSYKKPSPYGVTLIMSPWNYPFLLTMEPLVDAIAAGNTAVVKPSAYSPHTSQLMARMIRKCFSQEYVAVVTGGRARAWNGARGVRTARSLAKARRWRRM